MALHLLADQHRPDETIHVATNDMGYVDVTFDFDMGREFIGRSAGAATIERDLAIVIELHDGKDDLQSRLGDEIFRLRAVIERLGHGQQLTRNLLPAEARELAAMLDHDADEAERWRR